jgi:hypothetical protein
MTQVRRSFLAPTLGFATERRRWRSPCSFRTVLFKRHSDTTPNQLVTTPKQL